MSMLDSFFSKGFRAAKCKTLLKLTIPRIKLLRNRREIQIKQMRRDIAKLLETGQEATARIRVEHIIREENMMAAQEILELFSELIAVRLPIIEAQRECPLDLKEAISSLCFAAPRCADLPELLQVQLSFVSKYGKEFVAAATELMPDCGVNRQLIELLSIRAPSAEKKLKLLKQIAEEHDLDWDPAASETELFKSHEDLLNGPTQFSSGTKVPLPDEKHEELSQASFNQTHHEQHDSDEDLDLDFPEVPRVVVLRPGENTASAPTILPYSPPVLHPETDPEPLDHSAKLMEERFVPEKDEKPQVEEKQFLPFIAPPLETLCSSPPQQMTRAKSDVSVDLQDVLAAAQAAAETAERAAMAARSAASLAQLRISELVRRNSDQTPGKSTENPFHITTEKARLDRNDTITDSDGIVSPPEPHRVHESLLPSPSPSPTKQDFDPTLPQPDPTHHRPQRLPSMEDEPYFSYPNLFRSQSSKLGSPSQSFKDDSLSPNRR